MKICFVSAPKPDESGGIGIYVRHLVESMSKKQEIFWIYRGEKNTKYKKGNVNYIEIKVPFPKRGFYSIIREFTFNYKVKKFLKKNYFDLINSHATWGYWMSNYKKKKGQKIIHTYHGVTRNFFKMHLERFKGIKKIIYSLSLLYGKIIEKPPMKKADEIICVSKKVKNQLEKLYGERKNMQIIRTGVDLKEFKPRNKDKIKKELNLNQKTIYALYIGAGSGWNKGLDRAVEISKEIYKLNKNYKLILIGPEHKKVKSLIKEPFITFLGDVPRKKIPLYYNSSEMVFCLSRYEGGAPIMVVSEAMASGCLVVCSKSSEQEIIEDKKNGIIIDKFNKKDSEKILKIYENKRLRNNIIKNSMKIIKKLSLEKWSEKYLKVLKN